MRRRALAGLAIAALAAAGAAWWLLERDLADDPSSQGLLLPGFAARAEAIDRIEVLGAGGKVLVDIGKHAGRWEMPSRGNWPGNQREIGLALFRLGTTRRVEAKTDNPALHARLGVEAVDTAGAKGAVLRLSGGGEPVRLTIGKNHPSLGGSYVRVGDEARVWLIDEDIAPAREAADWLDRRLLDIPMARIGTIRLAPADGRAFRLSRVEDRFSLDGQPPAAMHDPDMGNGTAGFTDQLPLQDLAADTGAAATQTVLFEGLDGVDVRVEAWNDGKGAWVRLHARLDEERAAAWFAQPAPVAAEPAVAAAPSLEDAADRIAAGDSAPAVDQPEPDGTLASAPPEQRLAALRKQVADWQAQFEGRQFLLPPYKAQVLLRSREEFLAGDR